VFEGAFVHADNLEDVQGNRTTKVTNGSVTVTEVERVQKRPYVDERTEVLEASDSAAIGNIYVSNATMNWFYFPDSGVAQYFEPDEPFDDDAVRSDRAEIAAEKVEKYDLEYQGTEQIADGRTRSRCRSEKRDRRKRNFGYHWRHQVRLRPRDERPERGTAGCRTDAVDRLSSTTTRSRSESCSRSQTASASS